MFCPYRADCDAARRVPLASASLTSMAGRRTDPLFSTFSRSLISATVFAVGPARVACARPSMCKCSMRSWRAGGGHCSLILIVYRTLPFAEAGRSLSVLSTRIWDRCRYRWLKVAVAVGTWVRYPVTVSFGGREKVRRCTMVGCLSGGGAIVSYRCARAMDTSPR